MLHLRLSIMVEQIRDLAHERGPVDFGIALGLAYQTFTDLLRESLAAQGFTDLGGAYGYVFRALADEQPSQRELARRLRITDQGMAKIVAEMVARGYVARRADREDRRVWRLTLGPRGRTALAAARRFHDRFERELANEVGASAVKNLRRLLRVIGERGADRDVTHARLRPM
jgi:DNA-binding MarR family transcriptional regulator